MTTSKKFIGIDISKNYFDTAAEQNGRYRTKRYRYDENGVADFLATLQAQQVHCVMESTGTYHLRLAHALYERGIALSVVNPLSAKRFIQSTLSRAKTDRTDACKLVEYGRAIAPEPWKPAPAYYTQLQQLLNTQQFYIKERTSVANQLEAISVSVDQSLAAVESLTDTLRYLQEKTDQIDAQIQQLVDDNDPGDVDNLSSIPGIGKKTATALVASTKGMSEFTSHRQLSSYLGLAPTTTQSGTSIRGNRRICKMGMGYIRKLLYVCAWSASRCNKTCKELYDRLIKAGKPKKLAMTAVANKLLKQAFAIIKNKTKYDPMLYSNLKIIPN